MIECMTAEWQWESRSGRCRMKLKDFKEHARIQYMWESKSIMSVLVLYQTGSLRKKS